MGDPRDPLSAQPGLERQLALLIDSVADYAIFLLDTEGHVLTWNAGAERNKGYRADEIIGRHFSVFYTPEAREAGRPQLALRTAEAEGRFEDESWRLRSDGSRFWANVVITALRDPDGRLLGFGKVTRDLTDRHRTQEELERFASSAAHDLHEPLRSINGFAELLERRYGATLPPDGQEFLAHITGASQRMQELIRALLDYARSGARDLTAAPVDLAEAVDAVLTALSDARERRGATVTADVPRGTCVLGDRPAVELILQNFVGNALKFGAPDAPEVQVGARRADHEWVLTVTDNGPGIDERERERVFEAFIQLRTPQATGAGSGLGLSIARRLAERQGGRVGVDAAPGGGCAFWLALPAAE